ncbi:hypothetical protein C8A03DRAFT_31453 [Achaetomium macrosporum]|uniref:Uncharacterized protein n=1 Tax=Achaetomium macrosporum TaxID=79813 RepID=A0AAN7CE75_9PEZI|nr:hypothetical protein C8A03DRAFT_31453 [Achaetomium macrosporum]
MAAPNAQATPSWLAHIDEMASEIVPMTVPVELDTLAIIKKMLLAPADDNGAVDRAVQEVRAYYRTKASSSEASGGVRDYPAKLVMSVIGAVVDHVFELSKVVDRREPAHQRLADLLIRLKQSGATTEFDAENPQLGWESENLDWHAAEIWRTFTPDHTSPAEECTSALNTHSLLARLVAGDLFPSDGGWRTAKCISEGLQHPPGQEFAIDTPLVRACRAAIAAQYVLVAGDVLVRELQSKPGAQSEAALRRGEWGFWAERLKMLAAGEGGGDGIEEWDLKGSAAQAAKKVDGWLN